ncbi:outer membrane protein transport protein [Azospirillum sp. Sh1]|uniref:OmpP1/FadL family transporter n=1 Tax=Azospirillum sp. Sh1 TaxID=2607285 RepID=UPI00165EA0E9|nr:outer membrane protein transport protein [Azospirillum sp. Sh1]
MTVVVTAAGRTHAAGFQLREQSSEGLGNAHAGSAAKAYNLSTIWYNPAGMTRLSGNQTGTSITGVLPKVKFSGQNTGAGYSGTVSGGDGGNVAEPAALGAAYALWDYDRDLKFGVAVTVPFGLRTNYDDNWIGRYHALETGVTNISVTPSFGYRVTDALSVGGGVEISYFKAKLSNAINFGGMGIPGATDGHFKGTADNIGFGGDIGLLYEFSPTTRIGLNYRSKIKHKLNGDATFENVPSFLAANPMFANDSLSAKLVTPDYATFGVYHELTPQWAVMGDIQWTNWSTFRQLRLSYGNGRPDSVVDENWKDSWYFALGATYKLDERNRFQGGIAYDMSTTDNAHRNARLPDQARVWLTGGYSYDMGEGNQLNIGYAHLFASGGSSIREVGSVESASGTLTGSYKSHVDILSASFVLHF